MGSHTPCAQYMRALLAFGGGEWVVGGGMKRENSLESAADQLAGRQADRHGGKEEGGGAHAGRQGGGI